MSDSEEEENQGLYDTKLKDASGRAMIRYFEEDEDDYKCDSDDEKEMVELREKLFEVTSYNGCVFCEQYFFPVELLSLVLSFSEPKDLVFNCRRVCKKWCNVIDSHVWKLQLRRNNIEVRKSHNLKWVYYYWILLKKNVFNRNLVKNSCGEENFQHWENFNIEDDLIKIEKPPAGCEKFPQDIDKEVLKHNSCFAIRRNLKVQNIDLEKEGATPQFMDIVRPKITVTDWYCGRFDCESIYDLDVHITQGQYLDTVNNPDFTGLIALLMYHDDIGGENNSTWRKVSYVFENYRKGVECVLIIQLGHDSLQIEGRYGCKVTGTSVVLDLP